MRPSIWILIVSGIGWAAGPSTDDIIRRSEPAGEAILESGAGLVL